MSTAAFLIAGLLAFGLSFWFTQRLQRPRQSVKRWLERGDRGRSQRGRPPEGNRKIGPPAAANLDREVRHLLDQGKPVEAIKRVRETNGCSLPDAKAYVNERRP
ncbi:MAG: hypothetical protein WBG38_04280 [Nodosilinea sp.]